MKTRTLLLLMCFVSSVGYGQTHFTKFKSIKYQQVKIVHGTIEPDSLYTSIIDFQEIKNLSKIKIIINEIKHTDSSIIYIYSTGKIIQEFVIPYAGWHIGEAAYIADINNDGNLDIKFFFFGTGNGLAALLCSKIYLFGKNNGFKLVSFLDFASENEFDLNGDGIYEILSCDHVYKNGHSYWVYNAFNFKKDNLINVSENVKYPLWTKHLYKTNLVIAKEISYQDRLKEKKDLPDDLIIR